MAINLSIGFISYAVSFGVYFVMLALFLVGQRDNSKGKPFVALIAVAVLWSGLLMMSQVGASFAFEFIVIAELFRSLVWIFVLQYAMGSYSSKASIFDFKNILSPINVFFALMVSFILLIFNHNITVALEFKNVNFIETLLQIIFPVIGLVIVEQLYRNTPKQDRWSIQILCLSAASIFIYDIFVYSNALLWNELNYDYWSARGLVNVLVLPILILSAVRNPTLAPRIYISRHVVFHSTTLMIAGAYLILVSILAYFIKLMGGQWGGLLQTTVIVAGLLTLVLIISSTSIRLQIKNYLYANFFSNKYDYRDEWHRFSNTLLASSDNTIREKALIAVCQIMDSKGGALWINDEGYYRHIASWNMPLQDEQKNVAREFLENVLPHKKDVYVCQSSKKDHYFNHIEDAWFVLPLWNQDESLGFAIFRDPIVKRALDAEDKELLKTVSDHIALFFAQHHVSFQLMEAQKFQHISQMTAFLVHDLKTVLSQLLLMNENAKTHKTNPEFIDDMLSTIEHVATKMQRLILQLKEPEKLDKEEAFNVKTEIQLLIESYKNRPVVLNFEPIAIELTLNKQTFISAVKHIIQNAIDASTKNSHVYIIMKQDSDKLYLIIRDEGCGMSEQFIAEHLFRPFDSSKGVTGMGVGVFQSRQFFRSINGDVNVKSQESKGTEFTIEIPIKNHITNKLFN